MRRLFAIPFLLALAWGQVTGDTALIIGQPPKEPSVNFTALTGTQPPGICKLGQIFFYANRPAETGVLECVAPNTWELREASLGSTGGPLLMAMFHAAALMQPSPTVTTPTKPTFDQVRANTGSNGVVAIVNGVLLVAALSPSVVIDTSGVVPVIRAIPVLPVPAEEEFALTIAQTVFTLAATPMTGTLEVFRNGIRMRAGRDYTVAAKVITFTAQPVLPGDLIVARYWPGN